MLPGAEASCAAYCRDTEMEILNKLPHAECLKEFSPGTPSYYDGENHKKIPHGPRRERGRLIIIKHN